MADRVADIFDYDTLVRRHLKEVFSQPDEEKRNKALQELYTPSAVLYEPDLVTTGHKEISAIIGNLLTNAFPSGFEFVPINKVLGHHNTCTVGWKGVVRKDDKDVGEPIVTGVDVIHVENGKISACYVLLN